MGKFLWFMLGLVLGIALNTSVSQTPDSAKQHLHEWCVYIGKC